MSILAPTTFGIRAARDLLASASVPPGATVTSTVADIGDRVNVAIKWNAGPSGGQTITAEYLNAAGAVVGTEVVFDTTATIVSREIQFTPRLPRFRLVVLNKHTSTRIVESLIVGPAAAKESYLGSGRTEVIRYDKSNPLGNTTAANYEARTGLSATLYLPHMIAPWTKGDTNVRQPLGIAEQSIRIVSTLDVPCLVRLRPMMTQTASGHPPELEGPELELGTLPASTGPADFVQWWLVPEADPLLPTEGKVAMKEVRALRGNYPAFRLWLGPSAAATTGELALDVCRRYI